MHTVIVIPADENQPARVERIPEASADRSHAIGQLVGGRPDRAVYDADAATYVNEDGSELGLAPNERATRYALEESQEAQRWQQQGAPDDPWLATYARNAFRGTVVLAGETHDGTPTPSPPARFAHQFGLDPDALEPERPANPIAAEVADRLGEAYGRDATLPPQTAGHTPEGRGDATSPGI